MGGTVADVLKQTSVTRGALYVHFKNKKELVTAVIMQGRDVLQETALRSVLAAPTRVDSILALVQAVAQTVRESQVVAASLRLSMQSRHEFPELTVDPYALWEPIVRACLVDAIAEGELRAGVDPDQITWLIVSSFMGTKEILAYRELLGELPERALRTVSLVMEMLKN